MTIRRLSALVFVLSAGLSLITAAPMLAAAPTSPPGAGKPAAAAPDHPAPAASPGGSVETNKESMVPDDTSASRNAARSRMHECGHQWSTLKKTGAAAGTTWKEFSQSCLARK